MTKVINLQTTSRLRPGRHTDATVRWKPRAWRQACYGQLRRANCWPQRSWAGLSWASPLWASPAASGSPEAARRRAFAILTAAFGVGQIVGPTLAGLLHDWTGAFVLPSLLAAGALVAAAAAAESGSNSFSHRQSLPATGRAIGFLTDWVV